MTYPALAPKQQITCYSPETFEPWNHTNPDTIGIGGSETALIQMAEHLAARGHSVRVYAPIPPNTPTPHKGVEWLHIDQTDHTRPGHWIVSRAPEIADHFALQHRSKGQTLWLVCQDEDYDRKWGDRPDRRMKFDRVVALCQAQAEQFKLRYPPIADRVCVSSNGVRRDLVESVLAENLERDPYRIIYTSSPDRGLDPLLAIFERVREYVPEATLHVCYGFDNLDKHVLKCEALDPETLLAKERRYLRWIRELKAKLKSPGVVHHGRMPQRELYRQIARASVWMYSTAFRETNCCVGETLVETNGGPKQLSALAGRGSFGVWACGPDGKLRLAAAKNCRLTRSGAEVHRLKVATAAGEHTLTLTADHKVMLSYDGMFGPVLAEVRGGVDRRKYLEVGQLKAGDYVCVHPSGWLPDRTGVNVTRGVVLSVEPAGTADVYCMEVEPDHNFIADGIVVHNCITSMEHQALGAIPIVSPVWAVAENVRHGIHVAGSPNLWLTQAQFAGEAFRLMIDGARQEQIRRVMMPWALQNFAYERWVGQWEGWMVEDGKS